MSNLPSKREFLASVTNPETGEPYAKADTVGKFSKAANAYAEANRDKWAEAEKPAPKPKVERRLAEGEKIDAPRVTAPSPFTPKADPKAVRAWAKQNGYAVGERGRIHADVINAYVKAEGLPTGEPAKRPTPLDMPRRRPNNSGITVVGGTVIRQDRCGNGPHSVAQCDCPGGPRAYRWLEREVGGPLMLTLDNAEA